MAHQMDRDAGRNFLESLEPRVMLSAIEPGVPELTASPPPVELLAMVYDATGDSDGATNTDFTFLAVGDDGTNLLFQLDFVAGGSYGAQGQILLDTDGDRTTPAGEALTEARIDWYFGILGICSASYADAGGFHQNLACGVDNTSLIIALPKSLLPDGGAHLQVAASSNLDLACSGYDRVPDGGFLDVSSDSVVVQTGGFAMAPLSVLSDPAGDASAVADLQGVEVERVGENLRLRAVFHHSIEAGDLPDILSGTIGLDTDGRLITGFENTYETWPTFGLDVTIDYQLFPSSLGGGVDVGLTVSDPANPAISYETGIPGFGTDGCYRVSGNVLEVSVPLALLPTLSAEAVVLATTLDLMGSGSDRLDGGGYNLQTGQLVPFLSWQSPDAGVSDPVGDNFISGFDNEDLTGLRACRYDGGVLIEVLYKELRVTGEAMTAVHFDADANPATGAPRLNMAGTTAMGIERSVLAQWIYPSLYVITVQGGSDQYTEVPQLATINFAGMWLHLTVPYELLGASGPMDVYTMTMSGAYAPLTPQDDAPDHGVLSIPARLPGDANADGQVDDRDLNIILSHWGDAGPAIGPGDVNGDGQIDDRDLNIVLSHWGDTA